jgi:large subunit ribosomal protein L13
MKTFSPKKADLNSSWWIIDASDIVLGRLAVVSANLLRGKHKSIFARHVNTGDNVVIINAEKIALSGNKQSQKLVWRHSGYPGGISSTSVGELLEKDPTKVIMNAVRGMIPKTSLGRDQLSKLHVYAGVEHPHSAQKPQVYDVKAQVKQGK